MFLGEFIQSCCRTFQNTEVMIGPIPRFTDVHKITIQPGYPPPPRAGPILFLNQIARVEPTVPTVEQFKVAIDAL